MFQAQLMQEIRVKNGWSYGANATLDIRRDGGAVYLHTFPAVKDTIPALKRTIDLFQNAIEGDGLTDQQLEFARTYLVRSFPFSLDTPTDVMNARLRNRLIGLPSSKLDNYRSDLKAVTIKEVRAAAKRHLNAEDLYIVMVCTAKDFRETIGKEVSAKSVNVVAYDKL